MKAVLFSFLVLGLSACSADVESVARWVPADKSAEAQTLKVGERGSPANNELTVGTEMARGGTSTFSYAAPRTGALEIFPASSYAVNCNLQNAKPRVFIDIQGGATREVAPPVVVDVVQGQAYSVRFEFPENPCEQITINFTAEWVAGE